MNKIADIMGGVGILIALYLVLSQGTATVNLITALMNSATNGIKVLQGRG